MSAIEKQTNFDHSKINIKKEMEKWFISLQKNI